MEIIIQNKFFSKKTNFQNMYNTFLHKKMLPSTSVASPKIWIWEGVNTEFVLRLTANLQILQTKLSPNGPHWRVVITTSPSPTP